MSVTEEKDSIIINTDSYKYSHYLQYPLGLKYVSSYIESRGGRWNHIIFYGLQLFLQNYLSQAITKYDIQEAEDFITQHGFKFNKKDWVYIYDKYDGMLPIHIEAVKEGSLIPTSNVLVQLRNTDPRLPWLPQYLETALLRSIWYPVSVATNSFMCKQIIKFYLDMTGTPNEIDFKLHDFGARGVSSYESACIGGSAHLLNFMGTDTSIAARYIMKQYNSKICAFSIPASEHSTVITWGEDSELQSYQNMIEHFSGQGKTFACVIDSYDPFNAIDEIWPKLIEKIVINGGRVVLRPDAGNPVAMSASCIEHMMNLFGYSVNSKGYKVLPDFIRLIYGDGINEQSIRDILQELAIRKISADNIAFGMGGALLQHLDRDTLRFAMKPSAISYDSDCKKWTGISKHPITDSSKTSKSGILDLVKVNNSFKTIKRDDNVSNLESYLVPVFENGVVLRKYKFEEIKENLNQSILEAV